MILGLGYALVPASGIAVGVVVRHQDASPTQLGGFGDTGPLADFVVVTREDRVAENDRLVALQFGRLERIECYAQIVGHAPGWRAYIADRSAAVRPVARSGQPGGGLWRKG